MIWNAAVFPTYTTYHFFKGTELKVYYAHQGKKYSNIVKYYYNLK